MAEQTEYYFAELSHVLVKNDISTDVPTSKDLTILMDGKPVCHVEPSGGVVRFPDDLKTPEANELYFQTATIAKLVKEYTTAMASSPALKAEHLDERYRLLAEFNGIVLAGAKLESGQGYEFVTWEREYDPRYMWCGHYFIDGYENAKQDFAIRAGLIDQNHLFTNEQLTEIYHSIQETLEQEGALTAQQEGTLCGIARQIEGVLPDLSAQLKQEHSPQYHQHQGLNM